MKVSAKYIIHKRGLIKDDHIEISSPFLNTYNNILSFDNCCAYPPLINSHDHLIGNWFPRAGDPSLYPNAHIWVKDMKESESVQERNRVWVNAIPMIFEGNGRLLAMLGGYKNIFSGVNTVQDHAPVQSKEYYDMFPINIVRDYRQCHSIVLENFWGGEEPQNEIELTNGKMPFIIHLGEGLDKVTAKEFQQLKEMDLLRSNTLIIHGIALTEKDIKECAEVGASICWCPFSNHFLIGKSLDVKSCLKYGVNVVLATDSTLSGSVNLLDEMRFAKSKQPGIPSEIIYKMVTDNAAKALFLGEDYVGIDIDKSSENILLVRQNTADPYDNLINTRPDDIILLLHQGKPLFGYQEMLTHFSVEKSEYFFYNKKGRNYFVSGHPEDILKTIASILGYKKNLPYIPFQL